MANERTFKSFIRVRQPDGTYQVVLPINTSDEVYTNISTKETLKTKITAMDATTQFNKESSIDDMMMMLIQLSSFFPKPIAMNNMFVDDFTVSTNVTLTSGLYTPGKLFI